MLETLTKTLCGYLNDAGVPASPACPDGPADAREAVYLTLSEAETPEGGRPRYLGERSDPGEMPREVYGLRCKVRLLLEACVPAETEQPVRAASALLFRAVTALSDGHMRLERLHREEPVLHRASGTLGLRGTTEGSMVLLFDTPEEAQALFDDFVLRGELKNE